MKKLIKTLKSISDPIRLRIIHLLSYQELCVCEIVDTLNLPQSTVSRHLTILKNSEVVEDTKKGQWVYYNLCKTVDKNNFINTLIENELKSNTYFQVDFEKLKARLQNGRGC